MLVAGLGEGATLEMSLEDALEVTSFGEGATLGVSLEDALEVALEVTLTGIVIGAPWGVAAEPTPTKKARATGSRIVTGRRWPRHTRLCRATANVNKIQDTMIQISMR